MAPLVNWLFLLPLQGSGENVVRQSFFFSSPFAYNSIGFVPGGLYKKIATKQNLQRIHEFSGNHLIVSTQTRQEIRRTKPRVFDLYNLGHLYIIQRSILHNEYFSFFSTHLSRFTELLKARMRSSENERPLIRIQHDQWQHFTLARHPPLFFFFLCFPRPSPILQTHMSITLSLLRIG
jgi:hypothetical protein